MKKKKIGILFFVLLVTISVKSQISFYIVSEHYEANTSLVRYSLNTELVKGENNAYRFILKTPMEFTSFGIGWEADTDLYPASHFSIEYRVHKPGKGWTRWMFEDGLTKPDETATGIYFTDLLFGMDEWQHDSLEFYIYTPEDENLRDIQISLMDISKTINTEMTYPTDKSGAKSCPEFPTIIERSDWCGGYTACHNPTYSPTYRDFHHVVVHHGASPNEYTDGHAVVRSYWNWHVNNNGWSDIGYNYLFDKYGNFFLGRHNPNYPTSDVHAAHAGYSNTYSLGINYLGNSDSPDTAPTAAQNEKSTDFLAWWFDYKSLDPQSSADLLNQLGTQWLYLPRICGHRDVNATSCPGDALYNLLPSLRTMTAQKIDICLDPIPPTTEIVLNRNWYGNDFNLDFIDEDNEGGSGVRYSFYQVMDFDGTQWRANASHGFFNDNFTSIIHPEWTDFAGTWSISNEHLLQTNQDLANTNLYASVEQTEGNVYLYHWQMKISGSGTNRRAGMHFFCSDPEQNNRENSYMVFFRVDSDKVQLYKYVDNTMNLVTDDVTQVNAGQWYDIKIIFDTNTGQILAYKDNQLVSQWIDTEPYTLGNSISLRTANCEVEYDDIKVYTDRAENVNISVGEEPSNMIRYESPNAGQDAARIRTILIDNANNWSESVAEHMYIDLTAPETESSVENLWQTENFTAQFTDNDALSGIERRYYQVLDFDGDYWRANPEHGFYCDEMHYMHPEWAHQVGTWDIQGDATVQTDETEANTNIHSYLRQDLSNRYLYEFNMKIDGSGDNRRAGFHYFCDDPTLSNRGNSYFIWFREATKDLEFYKVEDNVFSLEKHYKIDFDAGQWYNIKLIFDRVTGEKFVYMDDVLVGEWTDPDVWSLLQHENHSYISFRSGNCILSVNHLKVYRIRLPELTVSIGDENAMIRYQNPDPATYGAKIKSIVTDSAQNLSQIFFHDLNIDWTPPLSPDFVNDGYGADIDITYNLDEISANWANASDPNSGISKYYYAVGTSPGGTDLIDWTDNGLNTSFINSDVTLIEDETYYTSVIAENNAGLQSDLISSGGVLAAVLVEPVIPTCPANFEVCLNDEMLQLSGAEPNGGIYSGSGVSGNINFNPSVAGVGTHTITYDYYGEICTFQITVKELPEVICPEDITVLNTDNTIILEGAEPSGGEYTYNGIIITIPEFNPAVGVGEYEFGYYYTNPATGCTNSCYFIITVENDPGSDLKQVSNNSGISIYPNPSEGEFIIDFGDKEFSNLRIYDSAGRTIYSDNDIKNTQEIKLNLPKGMYFLHVNTMTKVFNKKIIIN